MAITVNTNLQVEDPTGSSNWISYPDGVTRQTGECAHYRLYFTFSSTEVGIFNNMTLSVMFNDVYGNVNNISNVSLPTGATQSSAPVSGSGFRLVVNLGSGLQPGISGFIEFDACSKTGGGPKELVITTDVTVTGTFVNGATIPISEKSDGPTWTVDCSLIDVYSKTVTVNGDMYQTDAEAYMVEYKIADSYCGGGWYSTKGSWGVIGGTTTDILPSIAGVTPEIVYSNTAYTFDGTTISFAAHPPLGCDGECIMFRVRYPKSQVDALGGPSALGQLSNNATVHLIMLGDVPIDIPISVTHPLKPVPDPVFGTATMSKWSPTYLDEPIQGYGLYYNSLTYYYNIVGNMQADGNVVPETQTITDDGLTLTTVDDTTYSPGADEFEWISIYCYGPNPVFEYQTYLGGNVWITPTLQPQTKVTYPMPTVAAGDYITKWRVTTSGMLHRDDNNMITVTLTLKQRNRSQPELKTITNSVSYTNTNYNGSSQTFTLDSDIAVVYNATLSYALSSADMTTTTVNVGQKPAYFRINPRNLSESTLPMEGCDIYFIVPPEFTPKSIHISFGADVPCDIIENWNGTGNWLVHLNLPDTVPALTDLDRYYDLVLDVSDNMIPGTYYIDTYFVVNPTQAADPDIDFIVGSLNGPDIYDFNQNGNTTEIVGYAHSAVQVISANVVNVKKMSKSQRDDDFKVENHTKITQNELFQYKLTVRNDSPDPMLDVIMIDIFPHVGDIFGSQWSPILNAPITPPDNATVYYCTSFDPIMTPIGTGGTATWSLTPPSDISTVKSIKLHFNDYIFVPGESAEIIFDMKAPIDVVDQTYCYNIVQYIASADKGGVITPYLPAYSPPTDAEIQFVIPNTGIEGFIWYDKNQNGIQDTGETGINDVLVELYDSNMNLMYTTTSMNSPIDDSPGYYVFNGIWPGDYYVKFPTSLSDDYTLTIQHAGSDRTKDSDPNPSTGLTDKVTVEDNQTQKNIDAGYKTSEIIADVYVIKSGPSSAQPGDNITYTIITGNNGPNTAEGIVLNDTVPAVLQNPQYSLDNGVTWNTWPGSYTIGMLNSGATKIIMIRGTLSTSASAAFSNTAVVSTTTTDPDSSNNTYTATTDVNLSADVSIQKTSSPNPITVGQTLTYTLTASNAGPSSAVNVVITDTIPAALQNPQYSTDNGVTWNTWNGTYALGNMSKDSSKSILIKGTVSMSAPGTITNTATVSSDTSDPDTSNNTFTNNTHTENFAELQITKAVDKAYATCGDILTYTFIISCTGNTAAKNVMFTDKIPSGTEFVAGSVTVNGVSVSSANPSSPILVGTIDPSENATVGFKVKIICG